MRIYRPLFTSRIAKMVIRVSQPCLDIIVRTEQMIETNSYALLESGLGVARTVNYSRI